MASVAPELAVPKVQLSEVDLTNTPGSLDGVTVAYAVVSPTKFVRGSKKKKLSGTYNFAQAFVGYDETELGYTLGISSDLSPNQVVTLGQAVRIRYVNADFAAVGGQYAIAVAIFTAKGSGNPRLGQFGYMDPDNDFAYMVSTEPYLDAISAPIADLNSATVTEDLGDRDPQGVLYSRRFRTTGGVREVENLETVRITQDDATDYDAPVARGTDLEFSILNVTQEDIAKLVGADYTQFTDTNGDIVRHTDGQIQAVISQIAGNKAIREIYPPDKQGNQRIKLYIGNVDVSNASFTKNYQKTEQFRLDMRLVAAPIDTLTGAVGTGLDYIRFAP